jgi:hypothetical protein
MLLPLAAVKLMCTIKLYRLAVYVLLFVYDQAFSVL